MNRLCSRLALALSCLMMTGCVNFSPRPDSSRFFTLTPLAEADARGNHPAGADDVFIGIGPVKFPAYLDRDELVTRVTQNRFEVSENDRWIEPLDENFTRVLAQNLSSLLSTERIVRYPWQSHQRPTYRLDIEVLRFEPNAAQNVQLAARWALIDSDNKHVLSFKDSRVTRQAKAKSSEASAAALSEALGDFSREIAERVGSIIQRRKPSSQNLR
ncbi:MAG TPA: PqiC family protein [Candidatus Binatia bacterium]|nr:PqiC family protein [Candidatus Binatia bacterium]